MKATNDHHTVCIVRPVSFNNTPQIGIVLCKVLQVIHSCSRDMALGWQKCLWILILDCKDASNNWMQLACVLSVYHNELGAATTRRPERSHYWLQDPLQTEGGKERGHRDDRWQSPFVCTHGWVGGNLHTVGGSSINRFHCQLKLFMSTTVFWVFQSVFKYYSLSMCIDGFAFSSSF